MKNKRARQLIPSPSYNDSSTSSASPCGLPLQGKKIRKLKKGCRIKKKEKNKTLPCSYEDFPDHKGRPQFHKVFKEDQTCFNTHQLFKEGLKDEGFDNDWITDQEEIVKSRNSIFAGIADAVKDVLSNPFCIKNKVRRNDIAQRKKQN